MHDWVHTCNMLDLNTYLLRNVLTVVGIKSAVPSGLSKPGGE